MDNGEKVEVIPMSENSDFPLVPRLNLASSTGPFPVLLSPKYMKFIRHHNIGISSKMAERRIMASYSMYHPSQGPIFRMLLSPLFAEMVQGETAT